MSSVVLSLKGALRESQRCMDMNVSVCHKGHPMTQTVHNKNTRAAASRGGKGNVGIEINGCGKQVRNAIFNTFSLSQNELPDHIVFMERI